MAAGPVFLQGIVETKLKLVDFYLMFCRVLHLDYSKALLQGNTSEQLWNTILKQKKNVKFTDSTLDNDKVESVNRLKKRNKWCFLWFLKFDRKK